MTGFGDGENKNLKAGMNMKIKRALISVSDKTGIVEFAKKLHSAGVEIVSTGGTMRALKEAGVPVMYVSDVTGFPEIMDGRVKTLNPYIHGGFWLSGTIRPMWRP